MFLHHYNGFQIIISLNSCYEDDIANFYVIYEWIQERLSLQGKPDSWPSNSAYGFFE